MNSNNPVRMNPIGPIQNRRFGLYCITCNSSVYLGYGHHATRAFIEKIVKVVPAIAILHDACEEHGVPEVLNSVFAWCGQHAGHGLCACDEKRFFRSPDSKEGEVRPNAVLIVGSNRIPCNTEISSPLATSERSIFDVRNQIQRDIDFAERRTARCQNCEGTGSAYDFNISGDDLIPIPCRDCNGSGSKP